MSKQELLGLLALTGPPPSMTLAAPWLAAFLLPLDCCFILTGSMDSKLLNLNVTLESIPGLKLEFGISPRVFKELQHWQEAENHRR